MEYKYLLPPHLFAVARKFSEFRNGGAQATARLRNGQIFSGLLISNSSAIIALRGYSELPFSIEEIESLYQLPEDEDPTETGGWKLLE
jgi:hypothetical protein